MERQSRQERLACKINHTRKINENNQGPGQDHLLLQRAALPQFLVLDLTLTLVLALTLALAHVPERLMNYLEYYYFLYFCYIFLYF